jgi:hypothetical protein
VTDMLVPSHNDQIEADSACFVVSIVADSLVSSAGLMQLVSRVNEDLRRGDDRVGIDLELRYFEALATLLEYNRLKVLESKKESGDAKWIPNMQNVMKSLDKMSFTRVLFTMERLNNKDKRFDDVKIPIKLYKEMLGHVHILLLSDDTDHSELAVAALYRLFYTAVSERQDPLFRLLSEWKPSIYCRSHRNWLVELVGETLDVLQAARDKFRNREDNLIDGKKAKPQSKKALDIEQYILACMRFSVDEYFRKIASVHSIDMYTRLLAKFATNTAVVNKSIFDFLCRLCKYQLETDYETLAPPLPGLQLSSDAAINGNVHTEKPTLGHLLFNIQSLMVFSDLLNSPNSCVQEDGHDGAAAINNHAESVYHLQRLARCVVRRLEEVSRKNHLLFVELLFTHTRPHEFCVSLDSVYEAPLFARQATGDPALPSEKFDSPTKSATEATEQSETDIAQDLSSFHEYSDYGDEFDEHDAVVSVKPNAGKRTKHINRGDRDAKRREAESSNAPITKKSRKMDWTEEEDSLLKEKYADYAGSASIINAVTDLLRQR